jgi:transcriptional regulator with XRE-family HTH domain
MTTLRELRDEQALTQAAVAERLGVTKAAVSQYETGKRKLPIVHARPLAEVLGCSVDEVVAAAEASARASKSA